MLAPAFRAMPGSGCADCARDWTCDGPNACPGAGNARPLGTEASLLCIGIVLDSFQYETPVCSSMLRSWFAAGRVVFCRSDVPASTD